MFMNQMKEIRVIRVFKKIGAFSAGMFCGTVYGSVIATLTAYMLLR